MVLSYLATGAVYSRNRYASLVSSQDTILRREEIKAEKKGLTSLIDNTRLHHPPDCKAWDWSSKEYRLQHCTCGSKRRAGEIEKELRTLPAEPNVFLPMVGWPAYGILAYLKGGTTKTTNMNLDEIIARQEKELGIPPLN